MATISGFSTLSSIGRAQSLTSSSSSSLSSPLRIVHRQGHSNILNVNPNWTVTAKSKKQLLKRREIVRSVAKDTLILEGVEEDAFTADRPVSVPVLPSDVLRYFIYFFFLVSGFCV